MTRQGPLTPSLRWLAWTSILLMLMAVTGPALAKDDSLDSQHKRDKVSDAVVIDDWLLGGGSCSIQCSNGQEYETDAGTVIGCACDCASVCGGTCTATDGNETRECTQQPNFAPATMSTP